MNDAMRLGCCAYSYREHLTAGRMSLEQFVETCDGLSLDGVELTAYYFPSTAPAALHSLKRHCHKHGMQITGTAVGSNFAQPEVDKRREQVQMVKDWVEHSVRLGAPTIRVFAGPVPAGCREDQAFGWVVDCLKEVADFGARHGVVIALENHGGLTSTADQVLRLREAVGHDWLGLNLDFGNFRTVDGLDAYQQFALCAPFTVTTHAKSHMKAEDGSATPVDYRRVGEILRAVGYKGYVAIEYEGPDDSMVAVPAFVAYLRTALS